MRFWPRPPVRIRLLEKSHQTNAILLPIPAHAGIMEMSRRRDSKEELRWNAFR